MSVNTLSATVDGTGEVQIPGVFADEFRRLSSALDWARVYSTSRSDFGHAAQELAAAARHARAIADECDRFARVAFENES